MAGAGARVGNEHVTAGLDQWKRRTNRVEIHLPIACEVMAAPYHATNDTMGSSGPPGFRPIEGQEISSGAGPVPSNPRGPVREEPGRGGRFKPGPPRSKRFSRRNVRLYLANNSELGRIPAEDPANGYLSPPPDPFRRPILRPAEDPPRSEPFSLLFSHPFPTNRLHDCHAPHLSIAPPRVTVRFRTAPAIRLGSVGRSSCFALAILSRVRFVVRQASASQELKALPRAS